MKTLKKHWFFNHFHQSEESNQTAAPAKKPKKPKILPEMIEKTMLFAIWHAKIKGNLRKTNEHQDK